MVLRGDVKGDRIVVTITGHGPSDPAAADRFAPTPSVVEPDPDAIAGAARAEKRRDVPHSGPPRRRPTSGRPSTALRSPLELWNELEASDGDGVVVEGEGAGELPADTSNLAVRAYALLADPAGKRFRFTGPARARPRLVRGRDRARSRGGAA